jgi:hypothetical protein
MMQRSFKPAGAAERLAHIPHLCERASKYGTLPSRASCTTGRSIFRLLTTKDPATSVTSCHSLGLVQGVARVGPAVVVFAPLRQQRPGPKIQPKFFPPRSPRTQRRAATFHCTGWARPEGSRSAPRSFREIPCRSWCPLRALRENCNVWVQSSGMGLRICGSARSAGRAVAWRRFSGSPRNPSIARRRARPHEPQSRPVSSQGDKSAGIL